MITKKILVDDIPINIVVSNFFNPDGQNVVFLHGWGQNANSFSIMMGEFERKQRSFVGIDFPGFGYTPLPKGVWGVKEYAIILKSTLDKLGIKKSSFISHSFGGRVLIYLNEIYLEKIEKNVFIASAGVKPEISKGRLTVIKMGKWVFKIPFLKKIGNKIRNNVASKDYLESGELRQIFLKVINEDLKEKIKNISKETLLIRGKEDTETPIKDGYFFRDNIKQNIFIELDGGHFIFLDKQEEVLSEINKFLF